MTSAIPGLLRVLDEVAETGRHVDLWWRDDDAVEDGPELGRLLDLSDRSGCPVAVAVIPAEARTSLVSRLAKRPDVDVLVHGYIHANHAPRGEKTSEFGAGRPLQSLVDDARAARALMRERFGDRAGDIFVPPWNRIAPNFISCLPTLGFRGLSGFGGRHPSTAGLVRMDTHIDPVDWRGGRGLVAPFRLIDSLERATRPGSKAIGLLTHHLDFDDDLWAFTEEFLALAASHPAVTLKAASQILSRGSRTVSGQLHAECTA